MIGDSSLWQIKREDVIAVDIQNDRKTGKDFATCQFRHKGQVKFAVVKQLNLKPGDMDIKDWCITVLNTHYLVREEEKKRGRKVPSLIVPG